MFLEYVVPGLGALLLSALVVAGIVAKVREESKRDEMFVRLLQSARSEEERTLIRMQWASKGK